MLEGQGFEEEVLEWRDLEEKYWKEKFKRGEILERKFGRKILKERF